MPNLEFKKLRIKGFRGIKCLDWRPAPGINVLIGGGDTGKTTILDAIGLLLQPTSNSNVGESDFYNKETTAGFQIEAVVSISSVADFSNNYWPWLWSGADAVLPDSEDASDADQESVFKIRVAADDDFETVWNVVQPDGSLAPFPASMRRRLGLVRLTGDDRNDRDLRLVYGSALDRLISDKTLRAKISETVAKIPLTDELDDDGSKALKSLDEALAEATLPTGLELGVVGGHGNSIGALVGLLAKKLGKTLPLASWGAGTRRMVSLEIASQNQRNSPVFTIDEVERGLEPYRLKRLLANIRSLSNQSFVTTHSPIALANASSANIWYLDANSRLGQLRRKDIAAQQTRDPETFLWKIPVIVEGATEVGFVNAVLRKVFDEDPLDSGVRVSLGQGDDQCIELLRALSDSGISCAGFIDNDGKNQSKLTKLKSGMGALLFVWESGCIETNVIRVLPENHLEKLFFNKDGSRNGDRLRTVADRLDLQDKSLESIRASLNDTGRCLRQLMIAAATGDKTGAPTPEAGKSWKKHGRYWFKTADGGGGEELLEHLRSAGCWGSIEQSLRPFFNSILTLSGKPEVERIEL